MELSRQEYWSRLSFPPPGDLPDPGIKPVSPALVGRFFLPLEPPGKPEEIYKGYKFASLEFGPEHLTDLVEITGNFFYVNIGCCKQIGEGVPERDLKHDLILVQDIL